MIIFDEVYYITQIFLVLNVTIIISLILPSIFEKKTAIEYKNIVSNRNTNEDNNQDSNTSVNEHIESLELTLQEILQILKSTPAEDKKIVSIHQETPLYPQELSDKLNSENLSKLKQKLEKEKVVVNEEIEKLQTKNNENDIYLEQPTPNNLKKRYPKEISYKSNSRQLLFHKEDSKDMNIQPIEEKNCIDIIITTKLARRFILIYTSSQ